MTLPVVELVEVERLVPAAYNPRTADAARLELVRLSLAKFGWLLPIYATPDGEIASGHQRHMVATEMGAKRVPVVWMKPLPLHRRQALNVVFNRATNDMRQADSGSTLVEGLAADVATASELPDLELDSPEWYPVCDMTEADPVPLLEGNPRWDEEHSSAMANSLDGAGVPPMPAVVTPSGRVVNGMGRLQAAASKGRTLPVVTIPDEVADIASALLNRLSMDFSLEERYADTLRHNSFRRARTAGSVNNLPWGFVFDLFDSLPRKPAHFDLSDPRHAEVWRRHYGGRVVDFGAGRCVQSRVLREQGVEVATFEPFWCADGTDAIDPDGARALTATFLDDIAAGHEFDSIFLASVLNSVPFVEDRRHIMEVVAALCGPKTEVHALAASTEKTSWRDMGAAPLRSASRKQGAFFLDYEPGVVLSDVSRLPKMQKYHSDAEFSALWSERFEAVRSVAFNRYVASVVCSRPRPLDPDRLAAALAFEFDLPYPDGSRLGMVAEAVAAFSARLDLDLAAHRP